MMMHPGFYPKSQNGYKFRMSSNARMLVKSEAAKGDGQQDSGEPKQRERTYIMIKPDGVQRRVVGQIIDRFEKRGLKMVGMKLYKPPR
jgi:nucleoside-diphosphate kinase